MLCNFFKFGFFICCFVVVVAVHLIRFIFISCHASCVSSLQNKPNLMMSKSAHHDLYFWFISFRFEALLIKGLEKKVVILRSIALGVLYSFYEGKFFVDAVIIGKPLSSNFKQLDVICLSAYNIDIHKHFENAECRFLTTFDSYHH